MGPLSTLPFVSSQPPVTCCPSRYPCCLHFPLARVATALPSFRLDHPALSYLYNGSWWLVAFASWASSYSLITLKAGG